MKRTNKLTTAALLTALCVALLAGSNLSPVGAWVMFAAAAMLPAAAVLQCGLGWGALCYAAAAALSLLLFPLRVKTLLFVLVLGHYGLSKCLIERLRCLPLEWACKLALFNGTLALCYLAATRLAGPTIGLPLWAGWLLANGVFAAYDLGFTVAIGWYQTRLMGKYKH